MTSVKKRLDHVLCELDNIGTEPDEETAKNIVLELKVIRSACRETEHSPMCCFRYDAQQKIVCDAVGPMERKQFMEQCRECQTQIKNVLTKLKTD